MRTKGGSLSQNGFLSPPGLFPKLKSIDLVGILDTANCAQIFFTRILTEETLNTAALVPNTDMLPAGVRFAVPTLCYLKRGMHWNGAGRLQAERLLSFYSIAPFMS